MKKKILFIGAYGIENAGDDLPMLVMIDNLKKIAPEIEFEFHALTRHINKWEQEEYGVIYHQNLEYESREESKDKWFRGLNYDDDREIFNNFSALIKSMDLLIIGAGNFIIDISIDIFKGPIPLNWWYIHIAKLYAKKVFLYGFSTAPLNSEYGKLLTKDIINKSDLVTVRDQDSKLYLHSLGVDKSITVLPDSTLAGQLQGSNVDFLQPEDKIIQNKHGDLTIALGLRALSFLEEQGGNVFKTLLEFIHNNPQYRYLFIPQSTYFEDDDIALAEKLHRQIDNNINTHIITTRYTPKQLISLYSIADLTIAIRLHSAVFSQIAGTPAIAINYLPKVASYMKDFGTQEQCINLEELSLTSLESCLQNIQNNKALNAFIKKQHTKKNKQAQQYATLALSLLQSKDE